MSLKPMAIPPVPAETARVARAAFPKGNIYMKLRERVGTIIHDEDFVALFAKDGHPGITAVALGAGDHPPVSRESVGSPSRGGRARPH